MSKTVHPYSFRLGILRNWRSRWFNPVKYRHLLKADVLIREALEKSMRGMYVEGIEIERSPALFHLIIKTSRPGLLIGRKGEGTDKIKVQIIGIMKKIKAEIPKEIKLTVEEIQHPESSAKILAQMAAENLEKRMPFRRTMKQIMEKAMASHNVKGVKVAMSGRLDGSEMGRKEWLRKGRIPLQTLRADIDFAREKAHLPYGDIGIKVWTYKGEKFEE
uniref:30S ribosomal protein S3 n=1 Tax=uncultured organism TaxID=155900 RepID=U3GUJ7_9ZZZZ|nr:30S ribosomal protein S3 [uncultured organism]